MANKKQENDDSYFLQALHGVYKRIWTILFPHLIVILFKQRYINSVKSYKYLNNLIH